MKVFWVVAYDYYYPQGGLDDVLKTFATREEAELYADGVTGHDHVEVTDVSWMLGIVE
jgi:hypothetical protein